MADGKNIEIKIAATGGDQAAAEIKKVEDAAKAASNPNTSTGMGGMLDGVPERAEAVKKSMEEIRDAAKQAHSETGGIAEDLEEAAKPKAGSPLLTRRQELAGAVGAIGIAAGLAAKSLSNVYEQLETIDTVELRNLDAAWADQIEGAKSFAEALQDPIGALTTLANGGVSAKQAISDMNEQIKLNAEARAEQVDRVIERGAEQVAELKKLTDEMAAANRILDAKDKTASVARDGADAAAIRNGADPNEVRAKRAQDDAAAEIERVNRDLEQKRAEANLQQKYEGIGQGRTNVETLKGDGKSTREEIQKAEAEVKKREAEFAAAKAKYSEEEKLANERKQQIRIGAENTVADANGDKQAAEKAKVFKAAEEAARTAQQNDRDRQRKAAEKAKAEEARRRETTNEAKQGLGLADDITKAGGDNRMLKARAEAALRNPSQENQSALEQLLEQILTVVEKKNAPANGGENFDKFKRRLEIVEAQIKNSRNGK